MDIATPKHLLARGHIRRLAALCAAILMAGLLPAMFSPAHAATTFVVDDDGFGSVGDCDSVPPAQSTIQAAVALAVAGDMIEVCPGTYSEGVIVDKSLTISGPNAGISALDARVPEATITSAGTTVQTTATDVTIDGFTVSGDFGVYATGASNSGTRILNNIITGTTRALSLDGPGSVVDILDNHLTSGIRQLHITGTAFTDVRINRNRFSGAGTTFFHGNGSIAGYELKSNEFLGGSNNMASRISIGDVSDNTFDLSAGSTSLQINLDDSTVSGNTFDGDGTQRCLQLFGVQFGLDPSTNVTVSGNTFTTCNSYALQLSEGVDQIDITGNHFVDTAGDAISMRPRDAGDAPGPVPPPAEWTLNSDIHFNFNFITGSTGLGVNNTMTGTFDAVNNWWGSDDGPGLVGPGNGDGVSGSVDFAPWCVNETCTTPPPLCVGGGGCYATIQEAVDAASDGDTVTVNPGIYTEQVTIDKELTVVGSGDTSEISFTGAGPVVTITGSNVTLQDIKVDKEGGAATAPGCRQTGGNPTNGRGISVQGALVENLSLTNVTVTGATDGFVVGGGTTLDGLTVDDSNFDGNCIGWYLAQDGAPGSPAHVTDVLVTDSTFSNNTIKGIYAEKLSDALFDGITVMNSGVDAGYGFNAGIDINLKWQAFSGIEIRNSSVTGSGLTGTEPNPTFPAGITIKARDDGSYAAPPASLDGVLLDNVTVSGGVVGVRFGESDKTNAGPTNVVITNSSLSGSLYALANETSSQTIATGMWWDGSTGPFHVDNAGNGEAILGDVVYTPFCVNSSCTTPPTPTPTPTPTDPGGGDIVTPPGADPLPEGECDPETEICGSTGDDDADINDGTVITGPGEDHIDIDTDGDTEQVTVDAGPDNDTVVVNVGDETPDGTVIDVDGGDGDDTIIVNLPEGTTNVEIIIIGGDGNDTITYPNLEGLDGVTIITTTGEGDDVVNLPAAPGTVRIIIRLGSGDDSVAVQTGVGAVSKSASGASVTGGYDIYGGVGGESIEGSNGTDYLVGGRGRDALFGKKGHDVIKGGRAADSLFGGRGDDTIYGGKGKDIAKGGPGTDQLLGI